MREQAEQRTWFRKMEEVTALQLLRWQCPTCGYFLEQRVLLNTITVQLCHACQRGFQIKEGQVFVREPF